MKPTEEVTSSATRQRPTMPPGGEAHRPRGAASVRPSLGRIDKQGPAGGAGAVRGGRRRGRSGDCGSGHFDYAEAEKMHWSGAGG